MIVNCSCPNKGQDELHGKNRRVANKFAAKSGNGYRCSVCEKEHTVSEKK